MMEKLLIIGYGNLDRQDDGVAWHILKKLAVQLGKKGGFEIGDDFELLGDSPDLLFQLQLMPELAEDIARYDRVAFIDTHTGNIAEDLHMEILTPGYQASIFTHHMSPQTILALAAQVYRHPPAAALFSVRGFQFGFARFLSPETSSLADRAVRAIMEWVDTGKLPDLS